MAIIFQGTRISVKSSIKSLVLPSPNTKIRRPLEKNSTSFPKTAAPVSAGIRLSGLAFYGKNWLLDGEVRQHSAQVLTTRRMILSKLEWFLQLRGHDVCGQTELREFLVYLTRGHAEPGGRWGNPHLTRPVRPRTVKDYHGHLRIFFRWLVAEGVLGVFLGAANGRRGASRRASIAAS